LGPNQGERLHEIVPENRRKDSMKLFQSKIASYIMQEDKKGRDLLSIIKKIKEVQMETGCTYVDRRQDFRV